MNEQKLYRILLLTVLMALWIGGVSFSEEGVVGATPEIVASARVNIASMPLPDLTVPEGSISFDTTTPFEGRTIFIRFKVRNIGDAPARAFEPLAYYTGEDGKRQRATGTRRVHKKVQGFLLPGEELEDDIRWDDFDKVGRFDITVAADGRNTIFEKCETNNEATASLVILPDYETLTRQANEAVLQGETEEAAGLYRKSIQVIEGLREWAPGHPKFLEEGDYEFLLYDYIMLGDYDSAIREGRNAAEVYPEGYYVSELLASALLHMGATDEAAEALVKPSSSMQLDDLIPFYLFWTEQHKERSISELLETMNGSEKIEYLTKLKKWLPAVPGLLTQLGYEQRFDNRFDEAIENFETAFRLTKGAYYPFDGYRMIAWLFILNDRGQTDDLLHLARNGLDELGRPGNLLTYYATQAYRHKRIDDEEALDLFQEALGTEMMEYWVSQANYHSGVLQERLSAKYIDRAKQSYRKALEANKDFSEADAALKRLEGQQ